jgi:glycosyltransferase involved in cell wall biosynthesis
MTTFLAPIIEHDGYGNCGAGLAAQLAPKGVTVINMEAEGGGPPKWGGKERWVVNDTAVALDIPIFWEQIAAWRMAGFTMFESTRLPELFVEAANANAERVIVPNEFCREVFTRQLKLPVDVVPLGINTGGFPLRERKPSGRYTFLWSGTPSQRKGWDVAYRAFRRAFGDRTDVALVLHFRCPQVGEPAFVDENVVHLVGHLTDAEWLNLLHQADCMVYPARGEGHGMVPREAAATGLPVLCTEWGGLGDCREWAKPIPVRKLVPATYGHFNRGDIGEWAEPDPDAVADLLRWAAGNPGEARRFGEEAAVRVHNGQNWERSGAALLGWMEEHGW